MAADPPEETSAGEIPSDEDFGRRVVEARKRKGWNQDHLAARIPTSQPTISAIEAGKPSAFIPDVCRILKIPGPMFGWTVPQREWTELGHELERRSPALFKMTLQNLRQVLLELPPEKPPPPDDAKPKAKPVASANVAGIDREHGRARLRHPDELPGENKKKR